MPELSRPDSAQIHFEVQGGDGPGVAAEAIRRAGAPLRGAAQRRK